MNIEIALPSTGRKTSSTSRTWRTTSGARCALPTFSTPRATSWSQPARPSCGRRCGATCRSLLIIRASDVLLEKMSDGRLEPGRLESRALCKTGVPEAAARAFDAIRAVATAKPWAVAYMA
jgi:hypothetical protein